MDGINKRGANDWTVGKLLSIILLIVFLVLVIWGFSSGGLSPLMEKLGGKFDEVLIMLHIKDGTQDLDCFPRSVGGVGKEGKEFLNLVNLIGDYPSGINVVNCKDGSCYLEGEEFGKWEIGLVKLGSEKYERVISSKFKYWPFESSDWATENYKDYVFSESPKETLKYWEVYSSFLDLLEKNGLTNNLENIFGNYVIFYSNTYDVKSSVVSPYSGFFSRDTGYYVVGRPSIEGEKFKRSFVWNTYYEQPEYGGDILVREKKDLSIVDMTDTLYSEAYGDKIYIAVLTPEEMLKDDWRNVFHEKKKLISEVIEGYSYNKFTENREDWNLETSDAGKIGFWIDSKSDKYFDENLRNDYFSSFSKLNGEKIDLFGEEYLVEVDYDLAGFPVLSVSPLGGEFYGADESSSVKDFEFRITSPSKTERFPAVVVRKKGDEEIINLGGEYDLNYQVKYGDSGWVYLESDMIGGGDRWEDVGTLSTHRNGLGTVIYALDGMDYETGKNFLENAGYPWEEHGDEDDYKLSEDYFIKRYLYVLVKNFLKEVCSNE